MAPGIRLSPLLPIISASAAAASLLICALARISILIPAGNGQGVVFGRGKNTSGDVDRGRGTRFRKRVTIEESLRSRTYSGEELGGSLMFEALREVEGPGEGDGEGGVDGIGSSMSRVSGSAVLCERDVS